MLASSEFQPAAPLRPACAELATGHASPWRPFADHFFAGTDLPQRLGQGQWLQADRYWPASWLGDAQADPVARAIVAREFSRADFEAAICGASRGSDHPALATFVDHVRTLPKQIDFEAAKRGARLYTLLPPIATTIHGIVGGFLFAALVPSVSLALARSANIVRATHRRYMRTAQYVLDVTADQHLAFGGIGCQSASRVRLVHAFVRTEIQRHSTWNHVQYGAPIHPVATLLAATVTGTWAMAYAERLGCRFADDARRDMAMFTALQAHYQGVPAAYLPTSYQEWQEFTYWAIVHSGQPLPEDRDKCLSVLEPLIRNGYPFSDNPAVLRLFNALIVAIAHRTFGEDICQRYRIPRSRLGDTVYHALQPSLALHVAANNWLSLESAILQHRAERWDIRVRHMIAQTLDGRAA